MESRSFIVFVRSRFCFCSSAHLWLMPRQFPPLTFEDATTVSYPVKYINAPNNQFLANEPPEKFELKVDAHGFTLLRHKLSLSFSPIVLNLANITRNVNSNSGNYTILSKNLIRRISDQVSNEISISEVQPESFTIVLDSLKSKTIPVRLNIKTGFKPQFNLKEPISSTPQKVRITGPSAILDTIYYIQTKEKTFNKFDNDIQKNIDLILPEKVTASTDQIVANIEVERFTEKELKIPIQIKNKPDKVNIKLFPSEIKVLFTVGLSEFDNIKPADFGVSVDYNSIEGDVENLLITIDKTPSFNQLIRFSPEKVEFLIETK